MDMSLKLCVIIMSLSSITQCIPRASLNAVLDRAEWDRLFLLCDMKASDCPIEDILSGRPAVHISMDLTNRSLIVQMFEEFAAPTRLNWMVFCAPCEPLLKEINVFEDTHDLQGYFTYRYEWILVPSCNSCIGAIEAKLGRITNILVVSTLNLSIYTGMFGAESRYFQQVTTEAHEQLRGLQRRDIFPNTYSGLNNLTLVFSVMPWSPYVIKATSGVYSGYYIGIMEIIAEKLNFTFQVTEPSDGKYGTLENGQWTGMIGQLIDKQADIAAVLTVSFERGLYVTQMRVPVRTHQQVVIYHRPEPMSMSVGILVKPFSPLVWLVFICTIIITMVAFHITQRVYSRQKHWFGWYILRSTLSQSSTLKPQYQSARIIYGFYSLGWTVLMATYTACLVSLLSIKKEVIPFSTVSELAENTDYKLGVTGGSVLYDSLHRNNLTKTDPLYHLKAKLTKDANDDPRVLTSDFDVHVKRLKSENYALYSLSDAYEALAAETCKIGVLKYRGEVMLDGFMFQKNSAYAEDFDITLSRMQEGDLDKGLEKKFLPKPKQCVTNHSNVSLENIHGVFYILFGGLSVAVVVLVVELICQICFFTRNTSAHNTCILMMS